MASVGLLRAPGASAESGQSGLRTAFAPQDEGGSLPFSGRYLRSSSEGPAHESPIHPEGDNGSHNGARVSRLRGLREARWWSLDELAARTNLSAATISRLETGKRSLSLDLVGLLCEALQTDVRSLVDTSSGEDVIIRPVATTAGGRTVWPLTRPGSDIVALKIRLEPDANHGLLGVHPGHD